MGKKAFGIQYYILIFAFFMGLGFFFASKFMQANKFEGYIGGYNFKIIDAVNKAEEILLYIEKSASYALQQSVYDLAQNGGVAEVEASEVLTPEDSNLPQKNGVCGKYYGYILWYALDSSDAKNGKVDCLDENSIGINLQYIFSKNLNQYLTNHPHNIPLDNYYYEMEGGMEIIGRAIEPLKFDILKDDSKQIAKEAVKTPEGLTDFTGTGLCAKGSKCALTEEAYKLLLEAQKNAIEKEVSLEVYSAYRSQKEQQALWEGRTAERYAQRYPNELERALYVCNPYNGEKACPHMTGNVVDVRLKGKTTKTMTSKDWGLLYNIMTSKDKDEKPLWVKYAKEDWHFECCGTARYAKAQVQGVTEIA